VGGCADFVRQAKVSRRGVLAAGGLGLLGLGLPRLVAAQQASSPVVATSSGFGRAKSCIFFFMWGGPSQLDTFDMKPEAPDEVRGDFKPISTSVPGMQICEHFTRLAPHADKLAIVRSLHHTDPAHLSSGHLTTTGTLARVLNSDAEPPSPQDTPHIGSVVSRLRPSPAALPSFVTMPWLTAHPAAPGGQSPGQTAGWLGKRYDPLIASGDPNANDWTIPDLTLTGDVTLERLDDRRRLLASIDECRSLIDGAGAPSDMAEHMQKALGLLGSQQARDAFDLAQETAETRDRYGRNIHGQCALLARRLVEHGVPLVSVNWHNDGQNFWDTHGDNFRRLKRDLIPTADQALSALLDDLTASGRLDETLIVWVGEFGRRPQITRANAGREHWPFCYSGLLAGGGIQGGSIYGTSDRIAAHPEIDPVRPQDFSATIFHALGIAPDTFLHNGLGRPIRVCEGNPLHALFA
jgi:hypothetical protein